MDYNELKKIAESKKIEIGEIAIELEMTSNGFRESIRNETIQLKKLRRLCELLHIHPTMFFDIQKGVYLNNVQANVGNNNKISIENKEREIAQLRSQIEDKNEIIRMLREKLDLGMVASKTENYGKK